MKRLGILVAVALMAKLANAQDNRVLMTIEKDNVTVTDFLNIYNKNNTNNVIDKKSVDEYVELFINFKLKVKEAETLGMDTAVKFVSELGGYRRQLAQPYLVDRDLNDQLIQEAYTRMKEDVAAYHLLIRVDENAPAADTLAALKKLNELKKGIKTENDVNAAIAKFKADNDEKTIGEDLGYFTAFSMVYPFESAAYNTPVGSLSKPVRTKFGYHIIYVKDRRPARGEIKVAHIMIKSGADMTDDARGTAKDRIDEIYSRLKKGDAFEDLVKEFSEDKMTAPKGGSLAWFGTGRMEPAFEDAAFALQRNGDYSAPVQTNYGWHIIMREDYKGIGEFDELKSAIKKRIEKDSRGLAGRTSLLAKLKSEYVMVTNSKNRDEAIAMIPKEYVDGVWKYKSNPSLNAPVLTITDNKYSKKTTVYSQNDYLEYLQRNQKKVEPTADGVKQLTNQSALAGLQWNGFVNAMLVRFEDSILEWKYPEFKALMQEYHDGILLFDLMDQKVWSKAVKDSVGLASYYEQHKSEYTWPDRVDASVYNCADETIAAKTAKLAKSRAKKGYTDSDILKTINESNPLNLTIRSGLFAKGDDASVDQAPDKTGIHKLPANGSKQTLVQIYKLMPSVTKSLDECRGLVTSSYQTYLEEQWIAELRSKYTFRVDQDILKTIEK